MNQIDKMRLRGLKKALENCSRIADEALREKTKKELRRRIEEIEG